MLSQRRWNILHKFELKQRELFLNRLTIEEGLEIFKELYQFTQKIDKNSYKKFGLRNSLVLAKTHLLFMGVKS